MTVTCHMSLGQAVSGNDTQYLGFTRCKEHFESFPRYNFSGHYEPERRISQDQEQDTKPRSQPWPE